VQEYLFDFKHAEKSVDPRTSDAEGEVLTTVLEPGTPGSPEESLATRLFTPEDGKKYGTYT
jgi:hypothetical protein